MGSKNNLLTESFQTSKFGIQPISVCELPPPFMTFWFDLRKLCDENTNTRTWHVLQRARFWSCWLKQALSALMRRVLLFSLFSLACLHVFSKAMTCVGCKVDRRKSWISGWEQSDKKWYASLEEDTDWITSPLHTELSLVWAQIWRSGKTPVAAP